jgi:hypothetical protein
MHELNQWQNFYAIVGSSAGALIGLQFVVLALVAELPRTNVQGGEAFITPTIVHFGTVLLLAGFMCVPWREAVPLALLVGLTGLIGAIYSGLVTVRLRRQAVYKPLFEDWLFHAVFPTLAYVLLMASAWAGVLGRSAAFFGVAGSALLMLFIGIHNAWDTVTYHVFKKGQERNR